VLLASAGYGGTISAVRYLGANGFKVGVIKSSRAYAAAAWSRHASHTFCAPLESDAGGFLKRLLAIGHAHPGQLLLPTSDETAWLYTEKADELQESFLVYQPSVESMRRILDKKLFEDAAVKVGLSVLPSWQPRTLADVVTLAPSLPYPILIKRRTHVHRLRNHKGIAVHSAQELVPAYEKFVNCEEARSADTEPLTEADLPFLQQLVQIADEGVCSVTGFIDRSGELFVTRRATKVYQRSQPVGVGVCFESLPPDPELASSVRRLCAELGYFGIFEVEFLRFNETWAVIDFNPRLFNQVGMDIYRGMPLPLFAYLDATRDAEGLRHAVTAAAAERDDAKAVFCDAFTLGAILTARRLTGRISREELHYWRAWKKEHAAHTVDVARHRDDPKPAIAHALSEIYLGLKAIPKFLRLTPRASSEPARSPVEARS
jgi:predicted ATP-grasp superfamily ATP-dependent carboligase